VSITNVLKAVSKEFDPHLNLMCPWGRNFNLIVTYWLVAGKNSNKIYRSKIACL